MYIICLCLCLCLYIYIYICMLYTDKMGALITNQQVPVMFIQLQGDRCEAILEAQNSTSDLRRAGAHRSRWNSPVEFL